MHVGGFTFRKGHMEIGAYRSKLAVRPASSACRSAASALVGGFSWPEHRPALRPPGFSAEEAGQRSWPPKLASWNIARCFCPPIQPADSAVGNITFGRADSAAEPQRCSIPMSSRRWYRIVGRLYRVIGRWYRVVGWWSLITGPALVIWQ